MNNRLQSVTYGIDNYYEYEQKFGDKILKNKDNSYYNFNNNSDFSAV